MKWLNLRQPKYSLQPLRMGRSKTKKRGISTRGKLNRIERKEHVGGEMFKYFPNSFEFSDE